MTNPGTQPRFDPALAARIMLAALFFDVDLDDRVEDGEGSDDMELLALREPVGCI